MSYRCTRSNTQPGECGCFSLNGGGVSSSWRLGRNWALSASVDGQYAGHGPLTSNSLTLISYLGGIRYQLPNLRSEHTHPLEPYLHLLLGAEHAGGGLAGAGDGAFAFGTRIGGGVDVPVGSTFAVRILEADYGLSTFANGSSDYQNTLQVGAGLVFRWGEAKRDWASGETAYRSRTTKT